MNCFNHRDKPAVGLCKSCGKGLCGDCLTELPNGLACKSLCEDRVNLLNRMVDRNAQVLAAARHQVRHSGLVVLLMGIGFIIFSVFAQIQLEGSFLPYLFGFMGLLMSAAGILRLGRKEQYPKIEEQKPKAQ
jgi:hypothetical protein